jgi:leader peptidase (prepilin peptidase) / N-methyltransferase
VTSIDSGTAVASAATAAIGAASFAVLPWPMALVSLALGAAMMTIARIDAREMRIPDWLSLPAIPAGLLASGSLFDEARPAIAEVSHVVGMAVGLAGLWLVAAGYRRWRGHDGLGLGDVKLAGAAGAWVGVELLSTVLLVAASSALLAALVAGRLSGAELRRDAKVPFGAFLAPAVWVVWFLATVGYLG